MDDWQGVSEGYHGTRPRKTPNKLSKLSIFNNLLQNVQECVTINEKHNVQPLILNEDLTTPINIILIFHFLPKRLNYIKYQKTSLSLSTTLAEFFSRTFCRAGRNLARGRDTLCFIGSIAFCAIIRARKSTTTENYAGAYVNYADATEY